MKVYFKPEGGFGYFPGLNKSLELNFDNMTSTEADHLQELIEDASFFDLPSAEPSSIRGADQKSYQIRVEEAGRVHGIQVSDTSSNEALNNLVNYLSRKQQENR